MNSQFKVVSGPAIKTFIDRHYSEIYTIIRNTYLAHEQQRTTNPNSYFLRFPDKPEARIIALPAALQTENPVSGIKWISSYPKNVTKGLCARASAVIILNDYETGFPLACLEGAYISAVRTVCSAVLAAEHCHPREKHIESIGIVGTGFIAEQLLNCFHTQNWRIDKVYLFDLSAERAETFKMVFHNHGYNNIEVCASTDELMAASELIAFTTLASVPHIFQDTHLKHAPVILHLSLRDLAPEILLNANNIVDDVEHVLSANTSPDLAYRKVQSHDFINGTIGALIQHGLKLDPNKPTIFSPMGMGILDIAVAQMVYENIANDQMTIIKDFHCVD